MLIVGLGNPGAQYQNSRHNVGFETIEYFTEFLLKEGEFGGWKKERQTRSTIGKGTYAENDFILAKPDTFMNNSGSAVKALLKKYTLAPNNLVVVHDDIDITIGSYKYARNRGSAGHKGVQSIIDVLGTKDFWRIRIGIQPESGKPKNTNTFVLANLTKEEQPILSDLTTEVIPKIYQILQMKKAKS